MTNSHSNRISLKEFQALVKELVKESIKESYSGYGGDYNLPDPEGDRRRREEEDKRNEPTANWLRNIHQSMEDREKAKRMAAIDSENRWRDEQAKTSYAAADKRKAERARRGELHSYEPGYTEQEARKDQEADAARKAANAARVAAYKKAHPVKSFLYGANPPSEFQAEALVKELVKESIKENWGSYGGGWTPAPDTRSASRRQADDEAAGTARRQKEYDTLVGSTAQQREKWDSERAESAWRQKQAEQARQDAGVAAGKRKAEEEAAEEAEDAKLQKKYADRARVNAWRKAHPWKNLFGMNPPPAAPQTESYGMATETHEEGHGGSYDRHTDGYLDSMTWGMMPSDDLLEIALAEGWHMDLKGRDALSFKVAMEMAGLDPGRAERGMSTVEGMKQVVEALVSCSQDVDPEMTEICESAGSLAGSIMDVLGFEWV